MNLFIQQKVFSLTNRFTVSDETGGARYFVEGELFALGYKLHVYDAIDCEVAYIEQELFHMLPHYTICVGDDAPVQLVQRFTFFHHEFSVEELGWEVLGDFLSHDYSITCGDTPVANIHRQWMTWGDCYELSIASPADELPALAVVLAIDCVIARQRD